jgi:hypothetical protein
MPTNDYMNCYGITSKYKNRNNSFSEIISHLLPLIGDDICFFYKPLTAIEYHSLGALVICRMKFQASNYLKLLQISFAYLRLTSDGLFLSNPARSW